MPNPASDKQVTLIRKLIVERKISDTMTGEEQLAQFNEYHENKPYTIRQASELIDRLFAAPRFPTEQAFTVKPGIYEVPNDGIYVVKPNRAKTAVYAKRMIIINGDRLNELGEDVKIEFEYTPGAIKTIRPEHQMPLEQAEALSIKYGRCIICGARLKASKSVKRGVGPVCAGYTAG